MSTKDKAIATVIGIFLSIVFLYAAYDYYQQTTACDKAGGVLARQGAGYVCVEGVR